jgi:transcriptional regulator with XRE-family HTH domain
MLQEVDYAKLGLKIKTARKQKGLTQEKLAEAVSCNTSHISNIENNYTKVSLNVLLAIANVLGTSIDSLIGEQYDEPSKGLEHDIFEKVKKFGYEKKKKILKLLEII